jgi:hypothetical protein
MRRVPGPDYTIDIPPGWANSTKVVRGQRQGLEVVESGLATFFRAPLPTRLVVTRRSLPRDGCPSIETTARSIAAVSGGADGGLRSLEMDGAAAISFDPYPSEAFTRSRETVVFRGRVRHRFILVASTASFEKDLPVWRWLMNGVHWGERIVKPGPTDLAGPDYRMTLPSDWLRVQPPQNVHAEVEARGIEDQQGYPLLTVVRRHAMGVSLPDLIPRVFDAGHRVLTTRMDVGGWQAVAVEFALEGRPDRSAASIVVRRGGVDLQFTVTAATTRLAPLFEAVSAAVEAICWTWAPAPARLRWAVCDQVVSVAAPTAPVAATAPCPHCGAPRSQVFGAYRYCKTVV